MSLSRPQTITVIGDSTIDNTDWVPEGQSVVAQLAKIMPGSTIHDFSNDGFTTADVLNGAKRNKVLIMPKSPKYTSEILKPLEHGRDAMLASDIIVLSVGGNNIREFLATVLAKPEDKREQYIQDHFSEVLKTLTNEYVQILDGILALRPEAKIILMTQYYPSFVQNTYQIYPFMSLVSKAMNFGETPEDTINNLMSLIYTQVFDSLNKEADVTVADITSSLNPYVSDYHTSQIEPGVKGGKVIAELLKHMIDTQDFKQIRHRCVRLNLAEDAYESEALANWKPRHPTDFMASSHRLRNLPVISDVSKDDCEKLIESIENAMSSDAVSTKISIAAGDVIAEAKALLARGVVKGSREMTDLNQSLGAVLRVMSSPNDSGAVNALKVVANAAAPGKPVFWKKFLGSLMFLAGVAAFVVSSVFIPVTGGLSGIGAVGGVGLALAGIGLFKSGLQKGMAKEMNELAVLASVYR